MLIYKLYSLWKHSCEIWDLIIQYKENSPACFVEYWLNLKNDQTENLDLDDSTHVQCEELPLSFPHITNFTVKYIVNKELCVKDKSNYISLIFFNSTIICSNSSYIFTADFSDDLITSASLVDWQDRLKQLIHFQNLIWKNICVLNSANIQHK